MDNAHAHPQSPAHTLHARSRSIPSSLRETQLSSITPKSAPHTRQQRILHTRHARFSAQSLSANGINISLPQINRSLENETLYSTRWYQRDENDKVQGKVEELSNASTESAILNEISNSNAYRIRGLQRRAAIPIFQDSPGKHSNPPSSYHDASSDFQAYSRQDLSQDDSPNMGLREVSVNLQRPSPGRDSPYHRSPRIGLSRKSSQAKPRFNPDEYIEHIENELQSVKEDMYSPTTHLPWKEKLKKAKEDLQAYKKEMESMKASFEFEMRESVERSTKIELKMKLRIKDLEDEVDLKDSHIRDLESDREERGFDQSAVDALRTRMERLEEEKLNLEAVNRDMTKRNEVLTHLLALSPTKTQPGMELPTPRRRSARPMSLIIPRMPSSPGLTTSHPYSRPQSVLASPALAATEYFPMQTPSSPLSSSPAAMDDTRSIDSGLGESCAPFASGAGSRRSTLASRAPTSPSVGTGSHVRMDSRSQTVLRDPSKRRPRKFLPGSTQLKPLLLPTFTADHGNLPSASPVTSPVRSHPAQMIPLPVSPERVSHEEYVTSQYHGSPFSSPEQLGGYPGPAFQSLDEVFAEDTKHFTPTSASDNAIRQSLSDHLRQYATPTHKQQAASDAPHEARPNSHSHPRVNSWVLKTISSLPRTTDAGLKFERSTAFGLDDGVDIPPPLFARHLTDDGNGSQPSSFYAESPVNFRKRQKTSTVYDEARKSESVVTSKQPTGVVTNICPEDRGVRHATIHNCTNPLHTRHPVAETHSTIRSRSPLDILQRRGVGTRPLATLTIQTVFATLSRYTNYVQGFKRDPLAMARRVIANAWKSNWKMFGRLSWWVIGLFIGSRHQPSDQSGWDWDKYDGESIANRCCDASIDPCLDSVPEHHRVTPPVSNREESRPSSTQSSTPSPLSSKSSRPGWGKSLFLWGKFSVAIMLAVGGAIVKGPAEMMRDAEEKRRSRSSSLVDVNHAQRVHNLCHQDSVPSKVISERHGTTNRPTLFESITCGNRKARSLSSPPASPSSRVHSLHREAHEAADNDSGTSLPVARSLETTADHVEGDNNDATLKPARSERQGVQSIFQSSDTANLVSASKAGETFTSAAYTTKQVGSDIEGVSDHG